MDVKEYLYKEAMKRDKVTSSNIRSVGYSPLQKKLEVEFNSGAVYRYKAVPKSVYRELMDADSKGKYFHRNIRSNYKYRLYRTKNGEIVLGAFHNLPTKTVSAKKD